jgi:15-cis-phytoene synthase
MDQALSASYETCRRLHRRHDPTYYWASRRLPEHVRPATHALYGYVRTADEIVDGPHRPPQPTERRAALDAWEAELSAPRHPIALAVVDAGERHHLPLGELHAYMRSMRVDCAPVRIGSWEELETYMDGSAGTVGRIMAALLEVPERHRADFGRLGQAFQLTNFIRDVREDRSLDRLYLPADERERFGVAEEDFDQPTAGGALRALVAHEVGRARALFDACEEAVAAAPGAARPGIRMACAVYRRVLDRVEEVGYDVLGRRTTPRPWQVAGSALGALRA